MDPENIVNKKAGRPAGPKKVKVQAWVEPEKAERFKEMLRRGECPECPEVGAPINGSENEERVDQLREELAKADARIQAMYESQKIQSAEIVRLKADRKAESDPSMQQAENEGLKKRIGELEAKLKSKPVVAGNGTDAQVAMWKACADDFEGKLKKAEYDLRKLQKWYETTDIDAKCKKGWQMYYMLKEGKKGGEFDQEVSS